MFSDLPKTYDEMKDWGFEQIKPYADQLMAMDITEDTVETWLIGFRELFERIEEIGQRAQVATTQDTTDEDANERYLNYNDNILPHILTIQKQLNEKLVQSGIVPDGMDIPIKKMKAEIELFCEENLPLFSKENNLATEYDRVIGAQTVEWDGEEITLSQLSPVFLEPNRERRETAWRLSYERSLQDRDELNNIWRRFLDIRKQIAKNAGMKDYRDYMWKSLKRFDYTPDDAMSFFDAIEDAVVPALERMMEKRRLAMGLDSVRPWDTSVDVQGRAALQPFKDVQILQDKSVDIFNSVDPELGNYVKIMRDESYLDLDNRKGKAPGGYCTYFPLANRPFIFMNSVGTHDDVQTMLHEAGHAFHAFSASELPYYQQMDVPMEFAEVASMAMELLAAPYLQEESGGFYTAQDAARARTEHLSELLYLWAYIAVVARFQHWIYTNIDDAYDPEKCDDAWESLWNRYIKGIDYSGLEKYKRFRWRKQLHIFQVPFYYIEYGLAQLGAVQVWANSLKDQPQALADYRKALALGGKVSLPDLFATAGAKFSTDADTLREAVNLLEKTLEDLESVQ